MYHCLYQQDSIKFNVFYCSNLILHKGKSFLIFFFKLRVVNPLLTKLTWDYYFVQAQNPLHHKNRTTYSNYDKPTQILKEMKNKPILISRMELRNMEIISNKQKMIRQTKSRIRNRSVYANQEKRWTGDLQERNHRATKESVIRSHSESNFLLQEILASKLLGNLFLCKIEDLENSLYHNLQRARNSKSINRTDG